MIDQQKTFGEIVGMEPIVPCRPHRDDIVVCSDGTMITHGEAWFDCRDGAHSSEEDRDESDLTIVEEILNGVDEWVKEYCTENDDYTSGYECLIYENTYRWGDPIEEWIRDNYHDRMGYGQFEDCMDDLVSEVIDDLDGRCIDADWEYNRNEWAAYSGSGCCLGGFDIGEIEEQEEVYMSTFPEFVKLADEGRIVGLLERVNCNAYVSSSGLKRLQRDLTEGRDHACFYTYHCPGGRWDCVVSKERMQIAVTNAILAICRNNS